MTPELEQLKALAEAMLASPLRAKENAEFHEAATPERILALIAENEKMIAACALYDKALLHIYPTSGGGHSWELWNSARKTLGETK